MNKTNSNRKSLVLWTCWMEGQSINLFGI